METCLSTEDKWAHSDFRNLSSQQRRTYQNCMIVPPKMLSGIVEYYLKVFYSSVDYCGARGGAVVEALRYKPEIIGNYFHYYLRAASVV
jgi:hypothetical protein